LIQRKTERRLEAQSAPGQHGNNGQHLREGAYLEVRPQAPREVLIHIPENQTLWAGSPPAQLLGFTSECFDGYLKRSGRSIYILSIVSRSPGMGDFSRLLRGIWDAGFDVRIPIVDSAIMKKILRKKGFSLETDMYLGIESEVWVKKSDQSSIR
jgi:hypothetical protein